MSDQENLPNNTRMHTLRPDIQTVLGWVASTIIATRCPGALVAFK